MNEHEIKQLLGKLENGTITTEEELKLWQEFNKSVESFREFVRQLQKDN